MNFFNNAHAYADILVNAKMLSDNEPHDDNAVHALNTRIHNNALCGLLYEGADFSITENEKGRFIRIEYNNNLYEVPENAVKNILRGDFDRVIGNREVQKEEPVEESPLAEKDETEEIKEEGTVTEEPQTDKGDETADTTVDIPGTTEKTQEENIPDEAINETEEKTEEVTEDAATTDAVAVQEESDVQAYEESNADMPDESNVQAQETPVEAAVIKEETPAEEDASKDVKAEKAKPVVANHEKGKKDKKAKKDKKGKKASVSRGIIDDEHAFSISSDLNHVTVYVKEEDLTKNEPIEEKNENGSEETEESPTQGFSAFVSMMNNEANVEDEEEENIVRPELNVEEETSDNEMEEPAASATETAPHGFFKKKVVTETEDVQGQAAEEAPQKKTVKPAGIGFFKKAGDNKTETVAEEKEDDKKSFFGFAPKKPKLNTEKEEVVPDEIKIPKLELFDEEEKENHSNDNGELFNHIHTVVLRRRFGSAEEGPYRFIIWPTWIFDNTSGSSFAEILVHVTDPEDNEYIYVTQKHENDIDIKVNNKTFKVYGTWKSGVFTSHVVLTDKTASVYEAVDDVKMNTPKNISNIYLDQFRLEKRGYPSLFVVPFKNYNGGEEYIPIIGCVELNGARTVLPRRPKNELRYTFSGLERIVRGFWKDGEFTFTSEDANRMLLMNEAV